MRLSELVEISAGMASTSSRRAKVEAMAGLLSRAEPADAALAAAYLSGTLPQGRIGVGWATLRDAGVEPAETASLRLADVDAAIEAASALAGEGSEAARRSAVAALLERATADEQRFLAALLLGEVRHGALEGLVADAVGQAAGVPAAEIRRALMVGGSVGEVAAAASRGMPELLAIRLRLFRAVQPMLAQSAPDLGAALAKTGPSVAEYKYDGARIQVHRSGRRVAVFTRNMREITPRVPEIVDAVRSLDVKSVILDGEAIVLDANGRPRPFQETAGRFGSESGAAASKLIPVFFDILYIDSRDLTGMPAVDRFSTLDRVVPGSLRVPRSPATDEASLSEFFDRALDDGHEGLVVKSLEAPYEAGRRGGGWVKVKPVHTLDLVVLAVEWGHGRRRGLLSNLHLGARDPETGAFVMLGKTFKGLTDEMLEWQTERFLSLETGRSRNIVKVRPEQVVEVAFDGVQASSRYPGGVALRFARVRGYRDDKDPADTDTIETVRAIHRGDLRPRLG